MSAAAGGHSPVALRQGAYAGYTLRDLLTAIFYHQRALMIAFLIPALLGLVAALLSHTVYVSQARLLVLLGNDYVFQPTGNAPGQGIALDRDQIVQGELEILQSTTLAMQALTAVGAQTVFPRVDWDRPGAIPLAADQLEKDLTVTAVPDSNVVELSFRSHDPDVATLVLKTLIDLYLQRRAAIFSRAAAPGADDQRGVFAARLATAEDALSAFQNAHGISDYDTQVNLLLQRRSANEADRAANAQAIAQAGGQLDVLRARLATVPRTVELYADSSRAPSQQGMGDALARLEANRASLITRYRSDFPLVRDADQQIAQLRSQIGRVSATAGDGGRHGINPVWQDLQQQEIAAATQLQGFTARRQALDSAADAIAARLTELNTIGQQYRSLRRARDELAETFQAFVHGTEQTQLSSALERSRAANIRIVQPPEPPGRGTSLRRLIAAAGIVLGLVAAGATLVLLMALRQNFVTIRDAELGLDLPVLVAIPRRAGRR